MSGDGVTTSMNLEVIWLLAEGSTDRDSEDSETESEEDEDVEDGKSGSTDEPRLWPSQNVRTRWIRATRSVRTVADVSLALHSLVAVAKSYGVVGEDPLAGKCTSAYDGLISNNNNVLLSYDSVDLLQTKI